MKITTKCLFYTRKIGALASLNNPHISSIKTSLLECFIKKKKKLIYLIKKLIFFFIYRVYKRLDYQAKMFYIVER